MVDGIKSSSLDPVAAVGEGSVGISDARICDADKRAATRAEYGFNLMVACVCDVVIELCSQVICARSLLSGVGVGWRHSDLQGIS